MSRPQRKKARLHGRKFPLDKIIIGVMIAAFLISILFYLKFSTSTSTSSTSSRSDSTNIMSANMNRDNYNYKNAARKSSVKGYRAPGSDMDSDPLGG